MFVLFVYRTTLLKILASFFKGYKPMIFLTLSGLDFQKTALFLGIKGLSLLLKYCMMRGLRYLPLCYIDIKACIELALGGQTIKIDHGVFVVNGSPNEANAISMQLHSDHDQKTPPVTCIGKAQAVLTRGSVSQGFKTSAVTTLRTRSSKMSL